MTLPFSHFDASGASRMVDVSDKPTTRRVARASGVVRMQRSTLEEIRSGVNSVRSDGKISKGNVLEVARLAGIMAAKQTGTLIPLCHPLALDSVEIEFEFEGDTSLEIIATARVAAKTGVEMEALIAVSVAGLTIYDMCKSVDRSMRIDKIQLEAKSGGRSGEFRREACDGEE